jgi:DNA mismatch repair protein MutS
VAEYIHNHPRLGAKTLFATHYHELVDMANTLPRVKNFNVAVIDDGKEVVFLRKIVPGGSDKSYGIHVAQLAGLPRSVINRAQEVLLMLESGHRGGGTGEQSSAVPDTVPRQIPLWQISSLLAEEISSLEIDSLSPLDAITKLYELKKHAEEENPDN